MIWDTRLVGQFGLLCGYKFLQENGIQQMFMLGMNAPISTEHVFFFLKPEAHLIYELRKTLLVEDTSKRNYHLVFMPRTDFICDKLLENNNFTTCFNKKQKLELKAAGFDEFVLFFFLFSFSFFFFFVLFCKITTQF